MPIMTLEGNAYVELDQEPNECPVCHRSLHAEKQSYSHDQGDISRSSIFEVVYRCPYRRCGRLFIASYVRHVYGRNETIILHPGMRGKPEKFDFAGFIPWTPVPPDFPVDVCAVSPMFKEIYNQAASAEAYGLDQICGMGFRKALEFLIKDWCIRQRPNDAEQIKKVELSVCINNYADDSNVRTTASRAAWLGNDEAHYERKWVEKDIEFLKLLVRVTVNWIHNVLITEEAAAMHKR